MSYKSDDVVYVKGIYWVLKIKGGYEVYKEGVTHSVRVGRVGWEGRNGLEKAKYQIEQRLKDPA